MHESKSDSLLSRYKRLKTSHRFIIAVFVIWAAQAAPKWTVAVTADNEMSGDIMKMFVTPRAGNVDEV